MVTDRNRRTPLGNCALISANTEVVLGWKPGIGDDSERLDTVASGGRSKRSRMIVAVVRATGYRTMFRRSSGPLLGVSASKPKRERLSVSKGTREARSSRGITRPRAWAFSRQSSGRGSRNRIGVSTESPCQSRSATPGVEAWNLSASTVAARDDPQGQWQTARLGHSVYP